MRREIVPVRFAGDGSGEAPLTWAQADHWQAIAAAGQAATFGGSFAMPPSFTRDSASVLLSTLLGRHQALRTRLRFTADGSPRQVCSADGVIELLVAADADDPAAVAEQLVAEFRTTPFDFEQDWPVRMAVVPDDGFVHLVIVYLHLALDGGAAAVLMAEFDFTAPDLGVPTAPVTAVQPLAQAESQSQPSALRASAAALRYFGRVFRSVPLRLFEPRYPGPAEYRALRFRSPATRPALERIATEHEVSLPTAMLAVFAIGVARYRGDGQVWAMQLVSNRFRPGLAEAVSILVQASPCALDVGASTLAEALGQARSALLLSYKHAYYESGRCEQIRQQIGRERGAEVEISCYYNDRLGLLPPASASAGGADLGALLGQGELLADYGGPALPEFPLFFNVDSGGGVVEFPMTYDARYFTPDDLSRLARLVEEAAVELALTPDRPVLEQALLHR